MADPVLFEPNAATYREILFDCPFDDHPWS
jgi:hypothetical protein